MAENNSKPLGEIIKKVLKEKGLNQSVIAKKLNVSRQVINQIDKRKNFDFQFLKDLQAVTDIDFSIYLPIPEHIKESKLYTEKIDDKSNHRSSSMPVLSYSFGIPAEAYGNIRAFQEAITELSVKYGMIPLS